MQLLEEMKAPDPQNLDKNLTKNNVEQEVEIIRPDVYEITDVQHINQHLKTENDMVKSIMSNP